MYKIRPVTGGLNDKERETIMFAAREMQKYLSKVAESVFSVIPAKAIAQYEENTVYIGTCLADGLPKVEDAQLDDAICIDIKGFSGIVTGTNSRAVLIAVYRYLKEMGFKFLRPTSEGEYYPEKWQIKDVNVCEVPSYRHRAICIEGSVFQQNIIDIIDWLPKAGMNGYYIQFQLPREFFDRFYTAETPYRGKFNLSDEDIREMVALAEEEIQKRNLLYHAVGHGWTAQVFGIDGTSWSVHEEPEEKYRDTLALVNGKRALWRGVPIDTNLCYSSRKVRESLTDNIVQYLKEHSGITYLHFWLADGANNNCECDNCRKKRTSDHYVSILNELDEKLTKEGIDTKIVFLLYVDLLWKPLVERFKNSERFVMMFAPITRSYSKSYEVDSDAKMREYKLNKLEFPKNVSENIAYLKDWQQDFKCDSFVYDYHFMWDHYYDFAQYKHAQVLCDDVKAFENLGLNGLVSCQLQRVFLPTSLNINVMAETLWNKKSDFDEISDRILKTEFGDEYKKVQEYLGRLSTYSGAKAIRGEEEFVSEKTVQDMTAAIDIIDKFNPFIQAQIKENTGAVHKAWQKLAFHAELYKMLLAFYREAAKGNGIGDYSLIKDLILKNEMKFINEFDAIYFCRTFENRIIRRIKSGNANIF